MRIPRSFRRGGAGESGQKAEAEAPDTARPAGKSRKRRLPKVITRAEAESILERADTGGFTGSRDRLMLELMYRAGLRVSEVVALRPRDVQADGLIRIYDAKGGDGTAYFDPPSVWPILSRYQRERDPVANPQGPYRPGPEKPLFLHEDGSPVSTRYVQRLVKRLREELGIPHCTPHTLRHSFATELLEDDFSLVEVQGALRHANLQTTAIYLHLRDETLRRKMQRRGRPAATASLEAGKEV